jgi:ribonuclease Z
MEATYLRNEAEMAATYGHSTAEQAATLAKEAGVGKLLLTHISRRYRDEDIQEEARAVFPQTWVAKDFDSFQVKRIE